MGNRPAPRFIYTLRKFPDGPRKEGPLSWSLQGEDAIAWLFGCDRADSRPTVGEQLLVGASFRMHPNTPGARITSPITRIVSDEPGRVVFETASGSLYEWICSLTQ